MAFDWRAARQAHPNLFILAIVLKKLRTKIGAVVIIGCVAFAFWRHKQPVDFAHPTAWLWIGLSVIALGLAIRLAALGCLRKKEELATAGIYSLCRHPLYLGSIVMTYGFCFLLNVPANFVAATAYFLLLYPFTICWEEVRLSERYGEDHQRFAQTTPLILPVGRFRPCPFSFAQALRKGGAIQIGVTALLVIAISLMTEFMKRS